MKPSAFNFQPSLSGSIIKIRPLVEDDYSAMQQCAADKEIWLGHPARDRYKEEIFSPMFAQSIASKACVVVCELSTDKPIGWSRYYVADDGPDDISIGFTFLEKKFWGGNINKQLKTIMLNHAFKSFQRVWFHIDPNNIRSQKATLKLGATLKSEGLVLLAGKKGVWQSYTIDKECWLGL
ncbi:MAG: GNAT family N-acetyltransferase [Oceanospirillaceae bacterium]